MLAEFVEDKMPKQQPRQSKPPQRLNGLFDILKSRRHVFLQGQIADEFSQVDKQRVDRLSDVLCSYISNNLPRSFESRDGLSDYRTNPYVLMTAASTVGLRDHHSFGKFLFDSKLYMGLETSFGKSVEAAFVSPYPINSTNKWDDPPEKLREFAALTGLSREEKANTRSNSIWREIDKSVVIGKKRFLTSIKSGPNTINDTQVQGMADAILKNHKRWLSQSKAGAQGIEEIDVVIGLTYGTDKTTNNKENQILAKLIGGGFEEEDRHKWPGILIDSETRSVRVYRRIGMDFWDFIGSPDNPGSSSFLFLEILLSLSRGLSKCIEGADLETRIALKMNHLADALRKMTFNRRTLPDWMGGFGEAELFWFTTALSAFYDEGI